MRIEVLGQDGISAQARTYAEYRLFAGLSRVVDTSRVRHARLVLRRRKDEGAGEGVSCTVSVDIDGCNPLRIQTSAAHPYAAVNRAVERLSERSWPSRGADQAGASIRVAPSLPI